MQAQKQQPWFAEDGGPFKGDEPFYFNPDDYPWVKRVESQWQVIRDEMLAMLEREQQSLVPYANKGMVSRPDQWKTFGMMFWTFRSKKNCDMCPKTWAILKDIPNITAASFNLLEAQTTIKPHHGDTNAIIRCHMGLVVPASAPKCGFRVGTETRSWEEGKFMMFCDAHEHTAWNNTNEKRYILVVDIMRPEYVNKVNYTASRVLASINLAVAYQNVAWLKRFFSGKRGKPFLFSLFRMFTRAALVTRVPYWEK
ncbi:MAG: hypothetical protein Tsb002_36600 [Wenzhouxiangellaceae bacterium]